MFSATRFLLVFRMAFFTCAIAILITACNNSQNPFTRARGAQQEIAQRVCPCLGGTEDEIQMCIDRASSSDEIDCYEQLYDRHPDALHPHADCQVSALEEYRRCLRAGSMCDAATYTTCTDAINARISECPELPAEYLDEWRACDAD